MPRAPLTSIDELQSLAAHSTATLKRMMDLLTIAHVKGEHDLVQLRIHRLGQLLAESRILADLLGRSRALFEFDRFENIRNATFSRRTLSEERKADHLLKEMSNPEFWHGNGVQFFGGHVIRLFQSPTVPQVPFTEAIRDILRREPRLADPTAGIPLWKQVAELYKGENSFALALSTDLRLTTAIQRTVAELLRRGVPSPSAARVLQEMGDFTRAYSKTVFRTNLNSAYTAGRREMVRSPAIASLIGAFRFQAVTDSDVRDNHLAAHGLVAAVNDGIWNDFHAPLGYNCRCSSTNLVSRFQLERLNLIAEGGRVIRFHPRLGRDFDERLFRARAFPDEGFGGKTSVGGDPYAA